MAHPTSRCWHLLGSTRLHPERIPGNAVAPEEERVSPCVPGMPRAWKGPACGSGRTLPASAGQALPLGLALRCGAPPRVVVAVVALLLRSSSTREQSEEAPGAASRLGEAQRPLGRRHSPGSESFETTLCAERGLHARHHQAGCRAHPTSPGTALGAVKYLPADIFSLPLACVFMKELSRRNPR